MIEYVFLLSVSPGSSRPPRPLRLSSYFAAPSFYLFFTFSCVEVCSPFLLRRALFLLLLRRALLLFSYCVTNSAFALVGCYSTAPLPPRVAHSLLRSPASGSTLTCSDLWVSWERERSKGRGEGENTSLLRIAGPVEKWMKVPIGLSQSFVWKKALTCDDGGLCTKRAGWGRVG